MRIVSALMLLLCSPLVVGLFAQQPPPLVYDTENTGASFPKPIFPPDAELPEIRPLPDPFRFFGGSLRDTAFESWSRRRAEIKASIEHYEIGPKPNQSDLVINAVYTPRSTNAGVLEVHVLRTTNGQSLTLTSPINLPAGTPPPAGWPALIRMSLVPSTAAGPLGVIAGIDYLHDNVTQYAAGQQVSHAGDPYFRLYPEYNAGPCPPAPAPCGAQVGQYSAWSWGVSRLIDGLEIATKQAVNPLRIDLKRLAVQGCSYAGKMALFAGAFDERIALTFAQESGGGGAPSWRVSHNIEPNGSVEKIDNTDGSWFKSDMKTRFRGDLVYKLPHDHHELMAMVAPRALLVTGNTDFTWLSNRSTYVTAKATKRVYETFGIGDRFGFYVDGGHGHCAVPASQQDEINAFFRKFLLGQEVAPEYQDIQVFPQTAAFLSVDVDRWSRWWGTEDACFPEVDRRGTESISIEAESGIIGWDWETRADPEASNGAYVTVRPGLNSTGSPPAGGGSTVTIPFTVSKDAKYYIWARVNCPTANDDSFWLKLDNGNFVQANGLTTSGWEWLDLTVFANTNLTAGEHTLTIAYREDGALLDKVAITDFIYGPEDLGPQAGTCRVPPVLSLPADITAEATGPDGAVVTFSGSAHDDASGDVPVTFSPASGSVFPLGTTAVTATASDRSGNVATGTFNVTVRDTIAPAIAAIEASPNVLWSPNHHMVSVAVSASATDQVDPTPSTRIVGVASNEPVSGLGADDVAPDWEITGPLRLNLRAERYSKPGRVYTITVESRDASGNASTRTVAVTVPHNQ